MQYELPLKIVSYEVRIVFCCLGDSFYKYICLNMFTEFGFYLNCYITTQLTDVLIHAGLFGCYTYRQCSREVAKVNLSPGPITKCSQFFWTVHL